MCPVMYLSDGYLANGAEPWRIPTATSSRTMKVEYRTDPRGFFPYLRNTETLARPWAIPGTPGLEHRIGGIEKEDITGNISYDPANHERMVRLRQEKIDRIANDIPLATVDGDEEGELLLVGWGGTAGALTSALRLMRGARPQGRPPPAPVPVAAPANIGDILKRYAKVLVPELNMGQLRMVLRAEVPRRRGRLQQDPGQAVQGHRGRRGRRARARGREQPLRARVEAKAVTAGMSMVGGRRLTMADSEKRRCPAAHPQGLRLATRTVRWCPGCGDYSILAQVQKIMPELSFPREKIVFISGIGCSSRFPYYMNTYGFHTIHGRAPALASGIKIANPELLVWVVTGDGDGLSIGGNHLIHALRRNVDLKILLFNNRIYGLTKGQYSPTSEQGKKTKSTPLGSLDRPFLPCSVALGAEATFVARSIDSDAAAPRRRSLKRAAAPQGLGVRRDLPELQRLQRRRVRPPEGARGQGRAPGLPRAGQAAALRQGERQGRRRWPTAPSSSAGPRATVRAKSSSTTRPRGPDLRVHALAARVPRLARAHGRVPNIKRPSYDELAAEQGVRARAGKKPTFEQLLAGGDSWTVT